MDEKEGYTNIKKFIHLYHSFYVFLSIIMIINMCYHGLK